VAIAVASTFVDIWRRYRYRTELTSPARLLLVLVVIQATLGALVVLSRRQPWVNSAHVVVGAMVLTTSLVLTLRSWQVRFPPEAEWQLGVNTQRPSRVTAGIPAMRARGY
jgi:heme A synthase